MTAATSMGGEQNRPGMLRVWRDHAPCGGDGSPEGSLIPNSSQLGREGSEAWRPQGTKKGLPAAFVSCRQLKSGCQLMLLLVASKSLTK